MSLTKSQFLDESKRVIEPIEVPEYGTVWVGSVTPLTQSRREAQLRDPATGALVMDSLSKAGLYSLIDQVLQDEKGEPLFTEDDFEGLCNISDARRLDPLLQAVQIFNDRRPPDPNGESGSNG